MVYALRMWYLARILDRGRHNGEIDTVEGVTEHTFNQITSHTGAACQLPSTIASTVGRVVANSARLLTVTTLDVRSLLIMITALMVMDST